MAQVILRDVNKAYGGFAAVNDVSFTVEHGEFVALVGPSGCGKTTTLNLIAGLIPLTSGEIFIGDHEVSGLDPKDRDIAMVFQNYALYPNKTVFNNLAFPLQMRKQPKAEIDRKVREAARVLDITHLLDRRPRELSGGQQQRVALGRALVRDPAVFLMDEPLSNLDAKLRVQMRSEIKRFHHNLNATIVYVTHDQLEAVTMADKMAVMHGGLLQQYDTPAKVFANPVNTFVAGFVGSPAMSLIPVELAVRRRPDGAEGRERLGAAALASATPARPQASASGKAVLGARHSTLKLHKSATPGAVPGRVHTVEPTGDITFAQILVDGEVVNISLAPSVAIEPDESVWIEFDQDQHAPVRRRDHRGAAGRLTIGHQMKITAITPYPAWVGIRNQLIVKVETDEGIFGWGESGLSGREKAVVGAIEHYREFLIGRDPFADRRALAGDVPQPVFRGRAGADRRDLGHRHRAPRHQGQGARRAGAPAARRQAARP